MDLNLAGRERSGLVLAADLQAALNDQSRRRSASSSERARQQVSWASFLCRRRLGAAMAGAASALYILDMKGRVLIWRDYRGDVPASAAEKFFAKLMESEVSS